MRKYFYHPVEPEILGGLYPKSSSDEYVITVLYWLSLKINDVLKKKEVRAETSVMKMTNRGYEYPCLAMGHFEADPSKIEGVFFYQRMINEIVKDILSSTRMADFLTFVESNNKEIRDAITNYNNNGDILQ